MTTETLSAKPADVGITFEPDAPTELIEAIDSYLTAFDAPIITGRDGLIQSALKCSRSKPLSGFLGTFVWGIRHGEGRCSSCKRPARAFHTIRDAAGEELLRFPFILLYRRAGTQGER